MGSTSANTRAPWAAAAARFSVADVDGRWSTRSVGSSCGHIGSGVHSVPCTRWNAIPDNGVPAGTCMRSIQSSSHRHSVSSADSVDDVGRGCPIRSARSCAERSCATDSPPLTTYFPWSPASYQPPETSNSPSQPQPGYRRSASGPAHARTRVSPRFGGIPTCPAGRPYPGAIVSSMAMPERCSVKKRNASAANGPYRSERIANGRLAIPSATTR